MRSVREKVRVARGAKVVQLAAVGLEQFQAAAARPEVRVRRLALERELAARQALAGC